MSDEIVRLLGCFAVFCGVEEETKPDQKQLGLPRSLTMFTRQLYNFEEKGEGEEAG